MNNSQTFELDVGAFLATNGVLKINPFGLCIPLVQDTVVGRAADQDEQKLCGSAKNLRPYFDGNKIILPDSQWTDNISRIQGKICLLTNSDFPIMYTHISEKSPTTLQKRNLGLESVMEKAIHASYLIGFPKDGPKTNWLLLMGYNGNKEYRNRIQHGYYVQISNQLPAKVPEVSSVAHSHQNPGLVERLKSGYANLAKKH
jgi:hypothetical protein